jgi:hypothetical protein
MQSPNLRTAGNSELSPEHAVSDTEVGLTLSRVTSVDPPFQYSKWTRSWSGSEFGLGIPSERWWLRVETN